MVHECNSHLQKCGARAADLDRSADNIRTSLRHKVILAVARSIQACYHLVLRQWREVFDVEALCF